MEKKTKILAVGDIHGDEGLVKKLAEQADKENVDMIILAGDLTLLEMSTKNLIGPFLKNNKKILTIPGNHESNETMNLLSEVYKGTRNIHGAYYKKGNIGIFGVGHADAGPFFIEEDEIEDLLKKSHEKIKDSKKKILVTHMHHQGGKSEFSGHKGSKAIADAIKKFKPDFLIHGHVHEAGGIYEKIGNTKIINVSRKPAIFEI